MSLDWLIIGGGIHGVHIAVRLLSEVAIPPEQIRILDPGKRLLERWRTSTATTGMTHLRSPSVHHLDLKPWALRRFAGKRKKRKRNLFARPYDRPALTLFNAHCDKVIKAFRLDELHVKSRATMCAVERDVLRVELADGQEIVARNIVLAIGTSDQPEWPVWAPKDDTRVQHIFDSDFDGWPSSKESVVVVGGGISAAQVSLRLIDEGHQVELISRHALRKHQFDSDPGWLGPKFMTNFAKERDFNRRRLLIAEARHSGSVPPNIKSTLRRAMRDEHLRWHEGEVKRLDMEGDVFRMKLTTGSVLEPSRVFLATGFSPVRPGGALVNQLIASNSLPCADCGYPIVDASLCWHPRVYVSGPLAELELGPVARNIAGARRAGDRLVEAVRSIRSSETKVA